MTKKDKIKIIHVEILKQHFIVSFINHLIIIIRFLAKELSCGAVEDLEDSTIYS